MNEISKIALIFATVFLVLGILVLPTGAGPAIFQMFGSAAACLWGAWLFWEKKGK